MLKEQAKLFNKIVIFTDALILLSSFGLAYAFRARWEGLEPFSHYLWICFIAVFVWYLLLSRYQLHASLRRRTLFDLITALINVHLIGGAILAALIYLVDPRGYSRGLFLSFLFISLVLMVAERIVARLGLGYLRRRGLNTRNIIIVGGKKKALQFYDLVVDHADWGVKVIGFVQIDHAPEVTALKGCPVLGVVEDLVEICKAHPVDEVVFCPPKSFINEAENYLLGLEEMGITVRLVLDFFDFRHSNRELSFFHDQVPIITFHTKSLDAQQLFLKRILDITGALVGLLITAVLFPFIALAIKKESPGPVFFGQERIGVSGRTFRCWKFRTMYADAEQRKAELLERNEMQGAIFKIKDDPRITRVGKFLRKTSLDELPQFWNVFKGEMSLVGTRPPTQDEVANYENWHRRRISIKPGITGMWQVSGRNEISDFDEIVKLDLSYIDNWSIWLDIRILLKTLRVVLFRHGSY